MRTLDEEEKNLIKRIVEGQGYSRNIVNILDGHCFLEKAIVKIDGARKSGEVLYESHCKTPSSPSQEELDALAGQQNDLLLLLIKYLMLLRYLEDEHLVTLFDPALSSNKIVSFGDGLSNVQHISMPIYDSNLVELLLRYTRKEIIPSPALRDFVSNNFRTLDERRFSKQHAATWTAIVLSALIGIYGIYDGKATSSAHIAEIQQLRANQTAQAEKIVDDMKHLIEAIDEIDLSEALNDGTNRIVRELSALQSSIESLQEE
ncbi:hypothetical protein [Vreelandella lutescens]|uniref:Uncharacterized protein n=1 Tax=Vreelandella lutescens TaxID=1602943 RepID=A0ABQ1NKQ9_9GAMM|nr:hypothetical protein [Halomonas lutescens]GGC77800.1 hypothetical protein GCM10011382_04690 [Halomonas lutescens]